MADVTVNVRGNAASGGGGAAGGGGGSMVPSNERMIEDVRREMQQRGILLVPGSSSQISQLINQYVSTSKTAINENIASRYDARRAEIDQRAKADIDAIEIEVERKRKERYAGLSPEAASDSTRQALIEQELDKYRQRQYRTIRKKYDDEESALDEQEKSEKDQAETELAAAMKELVAYFKRHEDDQASDNSYIGGLRAQQKDLIRQRDEATTEEGAMAASRQLAGVNEKLRKAMSGGETEKGGFGFDPLLLGTQGVERVLESLQSGNIEGAITGGTSAVTGLLGASMKTAMRANAIAAIIAGGIGIAKNAGKKFEGMSDLAALGGTSPGAYRGGKQSDFLLQNISGFESAGIGTKDLGLNSEEFAAEAYKRIRGRGFTSSDWAQQTLQQISLERSLALSRGSLESGGKYDIYGQNVTDALSRLVTVLSGISTSGISYKDFTGVQKMFDTQQQIMSSYMGRADKPNYDTANAIIAAFSSVKGITQDSRIGSDIQSFQDLIRNPKNERMKSLIYGTVADLFPETGGQMELIDQELLKPENEGKIMQAVVKRISQQFGSPDTKLGYFAWKELLPGMAPERIKQYVEQISSSQEGGAGDILMRGITGISGLDKFSKENKEYWTRQASEYTSTMSKGEAAIVETLEKILSKMTSGSMPVPQPKPGGNR